MTYADWIASYLARFSHPEACLGRCAEAVEEMALAFPELEIKKGHVYTTWGKRGHWWLVTDDGSIVDPTAAQFPIIFEYEEYVEGAEVRVGRCMNCGEDLWGQPEEQGKNICSSECYSAFAGTLNAGLRDRGDT